MSVEASDSELTLVAPERDWRTLARLFCEMFKIAAFVLGGGYVILSVADERFSQKLRWIRKGELFEMLPVFQMIPGIIGGHTAVYVGNRVAGLLGAVVALVATALPSIAIFLVVSVTYASIPVYDPLMRAAFLGLRAALTAVMFNMVCRTWTKSVAGFYGPFAMMASVFALVWLRIPPGFAIVAGMVCGVANEAVRRRRSRDGANGSSVFRSFSAIPLLFLGYGLIAFGGGFVLVPAYLRDFVGATAQYLQLDPSDFANVMALTEMTPGPVAVNCATFFGFMMGGVSGSIVATLSLLLPGSVIMIFALRSLERFKANLFVCGIIAGVRPVATAMIVCATMSFATMSIWNRTFDGGLKFSPLGAFLFCAALLAVRRRWVGEVKAILLSALFALAVAAILIYAI